jgi:hypothetical protein|tara:strand:+ start:1147 stop:1398 length:252 start_codon:yes stop_codon:yes gene_type:complete
MLPCGYIRDIAPPLLFDRFYELGISFFGTQSFCVGLSSITAVPSGGDDCGNHLLFLSTQMARLEHDCPKQLAERPVDLFMGRE